VAYRQTGLAGKTATSMQAQTRAPNRVFSDGGTDQLVGAGSVGARVAMSLSGGSPWRAVTLGRGDCGKASGLPVVSRRSQRRGGLAAECGVNLGVFNWPTTRWEFD